MAGRRKRVFDVREMLRRFKMGHGDREVARDVGANRRTVARYRRLAKAQGWLDQPQLPEAAQIEERLRNLPTPLEVGPQSSVEPLRDRVVELRRRGVEIMALWQILRDDHGFTGSYSSVQRFVRRLEPRRPEPCMRVETPPGEEAQIDFGSVGRMVDSRTGELRHAYVFSLVLSFSRHRYDEIVFDQSVATWIGCHVRAFEELGGVPQRWVIDNLKAAITHACFHDPQVQRAYRELAEHYGAVISPCRVATPEHKGKVENGVHYVKRNALAGRDFANEVAANEHLKRWRDEIAGVRDHGTTHEPPLARFAIERPHLMPLPAVRYEVAVYKQAKLHPDCHVVFEKAYYSAPYRFVGRTLLVRATRDRVEIYHEHERVATHPRASHPGERSSNVLHYPEHLASGLRAAPHWLRLHARRIGPATAELLDQMLSDHPLDRLRGAQGVIHLAKKHGADRVEAACRRALAFDTVAYRTVKTILLRGLDSEPLPPEAVDPPTLPRSSPYARPVAEIQQGLFRKDA